VLVSGSSSSFPPNFHQPAPIIL